MARKDQRFTCYQPIQMIITNDDGDNHLITGIVLNATKQAFFIQTFSKILGTSIYFSHKNQVTHKTFHFKCKIFRIQENGVAVTYIFSRHNNPIKKGQFVNVHS